MKNTILKYMYILLLCLVLLGIGIFFYFNFNTAAGFFCPLMQKVYTTKLIYILSLYLLAGFIIGVLFSAIRQFKVNDLCNAYQKRHENNSVEKDTDKAKIAALEAKIATLEAALDSALNKNN